MTGAKLGSSGELEQRATSRQRRSVAASFFAAAVENGAASFEVGDIGHTTVELDALEESWGAPVVVGSGSWRSVIVIF